MLIQDYYVNLYSMIIGRNKLLSPIRFLIRGIANVHIPFIFKFFPKGKCNITEGNIIVSLTTFPARVEKLWIVIESLLRQTIKPERILLWLSKEQFSSLDDLPDSLLKMQKRGLEIRFVEGDIRSHKKYYYVCQEFPNKMVLLVDDDIIYGSKTLQQLLEAYNESTERRKIVFRYGYQMIYDNGNLISYNKWKHIYEASKSKNLFFGSGGGTLFVPSDLYKDCTDLEMALKLCPQADDVWLNAMAKLNNCNYLKVKDGPILPVYNKSNISLCTTNLRENMNDVQIRQLIDYCIDAYDKNPFDINR